MANSWIVEGSTPLFFRHLPGNSNPLIPRDIQRADIVLGREACGLKHEVMTSFKSPRLRKGWTIIYKGFDSRHGDIRMVIIYNLFTGCYD